MASVMSRDGTSIAYDKRGSGPVMILVLGALNKRGSGKKLAQALAADFTTITYDRRGRGDSGDTKPYTVEREIDDLEALIDQRGGSAFLYGHSSGGVLSLMAAQNLGAKVRGLGLYEIPYNHDPAARQAFETYKQRLAQHLAAHDEGEAVALFVRSVGVTDKQVEAMRRLPLWASLTGMAPTLEYDTVELMERFPEIDAQRIDVPALVMYGAASPSFMGETARELAQAMPNATLRSLEQQSHDVKPDVLAPVLVDFFG